MSGFNINDEVWVRFTPAGLACVPREQLPYLHVTASGYYRVQLWCLMAWIGGRHMCNGMPSPLLEHNELHWAEPGRESAGIPTTP
jgi:hypothetical protein